MILKVLKIARAFRRVQFENFQNHEYLLFTNCTRRSCGFFIYSTFNKITSFPWKLNRYSYEVQFGINCTVLDQSKLSNFVECTIRSEISQWDPAITKCHGTEKNVRYSGVFVIAKTPL